MILLALFITAVAAAPSIDHAIDPVWTQNCGTSSIPGAGTWPPPETRIVGGIEAQKHEFPWTTSLRRGTGSHFCGGVIITADWVLTAAHCVAGENPSLLRIDVGQHQRSVSDPATITHNVAILTVHENYNPALIDNDIAVMKTETSINIGDTSSAACQPEGGTNDYTGQASQCAGWGTTSWGGSSADILQWVEVFLLSNEECREHYTVITDNMICAGFENHQERDACQGDSGGPLTVKRGGNGLFEIVGLVSWGYRCAWGDPGVYTNVPTLKGWVTEKIGESN